MQDEDIKLAILNALDANGTAPEIKARIRSRIFTVLQDKSEPRAPKPPNNIYLCNELIRDYMLKMGYHNTLSVFVEEVAGDDPMDRNLLSAEINGKSAEIDDESPLLLCVLDEKLRK